jgi:myo-inositol 2-dehydrogenase/D-chiro-inositol 1-dehydrogenase
MTVRIGFAGAGFIAGVHAGVLAALPDVRVSAVLEPDEARAHAFEARTGARPLPSYEALLEESDAVYICVPNTLHAGLAVEALDADRHVFSEKPMATTLADASGVRAAAGRSDAVYQVGFNRRFAPVYRDLKGRIESGELAPRWGHVKMNRGELQRPRWVDDTSLTGGFLYETPVHVFDLACWLFGPLDEVVCRAAQTAYRELDDFAMLLTFRSGLTATFCSSAHATWLFPFERLEVYGEHAVAVSEEMERITFQRSLDAESWTLDVTQLPMPRRWGYAQEDEAFVAAVRGEAPPAVSAADGERAVRLVDACYRAARTREPVRMEDEGRG